MGTRKKQRPFERANGQPAADAIALYLRVSTEDQAERETIKTQLDFLQRWADLSGKRIADVYVDDGISGTGPIEKRPDGRRLLADAAGGRFRTVVFFRLNRLGRSLATVLGAQTQL